MANCHGLVRYMQWWLSFCAACQAINLYCIHAMNSNGITSLIGMVISYICVLNQRSHCYRYAKDAGANVSACRRLCITMFQNICYFWVLNIINWNRFSLHRLVGGCSRAFVECSSSFISKKCNRNRCFGLLQRGVVRTVRCSKRVLRDVSEWFRKASHDVSECWGCWAWGMF